MKYTTSSKLIFLLALIGSMAGSFWQQAEPEDRTSRVPLYLITGGLYAVLLDRFLTKRL
jgi:hypothetical protein